MRQLATVTLIALYGWPSGVETQRSGSGSAVEDIYVARSLRLSRIAPTAYCTLERIGFAGSTAEDQYTFHSTATRSSDGLMTNANVATIGRLHACFGSTADPLTSNFYAESALGGGFSQFSPRNRLPQILMKIFLLYSQ